MILEFKDIERFIPVITEQVRKEFEEERFLSYPKGLQEFLYGKVTDATYQKVYSLWNKKDFPRIDKGGVRGIYLSDLKQWQKS